MKTKLSSPPIKTIHTIPKIKPRLKKPISFIQQWSIQPPEHIQINLTKTKLLLFYKSSITLLDINTSKSTSLTIKCEAGLFYQKNNLQQNILIASNSTILLVSQNLQIQRKIQRADTLHQVKHFIINPKRGLIGSVSSHCIQIYNNSLQQLKCFSPKSTIRSAQFICQNHQLVVLQSTGILSTYSLMSLQIISTINIKTTGLSKWCFIKLNDYLVITGDENGIIVGNYVHKYKKYQMKNNKVLKLKQNILVMLESDIISRVNVEIDGITIQKLYSQQNIIDFFLFDENSIIVIKETGIILKKINVKKNQSIKKQQQLEQTMNKQSLLKKLKQYLKKGDIQINRSVIHPLILQIPYDIHQYRYLLQKSLHQMEDIKNQQVKQIIKVLFQVDVKIQYSKKVSLQMVILCLLYIYKDPIKTIQVFLRFITFNKEVFDLQISDNQVIQTLNKITTLKKQKQMTFIFPLVKAIRKIMSNFLVDILPKPIWLRFWDFMISSTDKSKNSYLLYVISLLITLNKQSHKPLTQSKIMNQLYNLSPQSHFQAQQFSLKHSQKQQIHYNIYSVSLKYLWKQFQSQQQLNQNLDKLDKLSQRLQQKLLNSITASKYNSLQRSQYGGRKVTFQNNIIEQKLNSKLRK